jgi:hypothetical protein
MTATNSADHTPPQQAVQDRQWSPLRLSIGFNLSELVSSALSMTDTRVRHMAVRNVLNLIQAGCNDEQQWRDAIETLGELIAVHPDAHKESGTWYDGAPSILALAAANEAATVAMFKLNPSLHSQDEIDGRTYKAFKYLLRGLAQQPDKAMSGLKWLERLLGLQPPAESTKAS